MNPTLAEPPMTVRDALNLLHPGFLHGVATRPKPLAGQLCGERGGRFASQQ